MSPDGLDPQEMVYGDTYKPRKRRKPAQTTTSNISNELNVLLKYSNCPPLVRRELVLVLTKYIQQEKSALLNELLEQGERMYYPNHIASEGAVPVSVIETKLKELKDEK